MHTHEPWDSRQGAKVDSSLGYEGTDVKVSGIIVFLTALGIFVVVTAVLCVGIGKVINSQLAKADGPVTKWNHPVDVRKLGNLATSPELQQQFSQLTNRFPTPRLQNDDGYQEITDMHAKEDLLLNNYSYVDQSKGTVRIPIDRAMELIAERGLPQAPENEAVIEKPLADAAAPVVKAPLTSGFARTGYEQDQIAKAEAIKAQE
ncbi:hypothetical protein [Acidicapsa ligni]|uniref:hypothetical protein n=1 Tax=Acidicapsa ligni TaxID=542300 RepID=UPI0021E0DE53|nr:hypothetical protein [Acidicapsa ligni]